MKSSVPDRVFGRVVSSLEGLGRVVRVSLAGRVAAVAVLSGVLLSACAGAGGGLEVPDMPTGGVTSTASPSPSSGGPGGSVAPSPSSSDDTTSNDGGAQTGGSGSSGSGSYEDLVKEREEAEKFGPAAPADRGTVMGLVGSDSAASPQPGAAGGFSASDTAEAAAVAGWIAGQVKVGSFVTTSVKNGSAYGTVIRERLAAVATRGLLGDLQSTASVWASKAPADYFGNQQVVGQFVWMGAGLCSESGRQCVGWPDMELVGVSGSSVSGRPALAVTYRESYVVDDAVIPGGSEASDARISIPVTYVMIRNEFEGGASWLLAGVSFGEATVEAV